MIHKYHFKNAWSFAEQTEVSFVLNQHAPEIDSVFTSPRGVRLSKLMAVQGANGAGKTNVLKALSFLSWFIARSFFAKRNTPLEIDSHFFLPDEPSEFEIEFECDGTHYLYQLVLDEEQVMHEALHQKVKTSFSYLFDRRLTESGDSKIRQKGFGFPSKQVAKVRPNVSLLSVAAQYNVACAIKLTDYFDSINTNTGPVEAISFLSVGKFFNDHPKLHQKMVKFMSKVDFGLSDVVIEMLPLDGKKLEKLEAFTFGMHHHGRKKAMLPLWAESEGTQTMFVLLQKILPTLERGGMVILDEMDSGLHPDMVMAILDLFTDSESNPHNAQFIFTSYVPDVMDALLKEQLLLVEKNPTNGYSEAWRLDRIKNIRRDENLYGKYRAGAYGALPNI